MRISAGQNRQAILAAALVLSSLATPARAEGVPAQETDDPLQVELVYTAELNSNLSGGVQTGSRYLDNLDITADIDLERLAGWSGARAHVYGLYNNGTAFSPLVGDSFVTSNIETGVRAFRLYEAWVDKTIGQSVSVRAGLYDLNSEFDALETSSLFLSSAHGIGTDISQTGENGPSIFPVTSLALRLAIAPADGWKVRLAVLDGVPGDPARPARTAIKIGKQDGALIIGEVERSLGGGRIFAGYWQYTAEFDDLSGSRRKGNRGLYLRGEAPLHDESGDTDQGLAAFFRLGVANGEINPFKAFASAGLVWTGPLHGRDEDRLGLAYARAFSSASFIRQSLARSSESSVELTYRAPINGWLTIQPSLQYVINPGALPGPRNAVVAALRLETALGF
ncbi:carbohydrate porin [Novosphingobium aquae]|uniref:Carbohydrate porin n=1 Tax=Novosphingobium aquae TaxID=3133435 RepID=A0ABU8SCB0_9SPHN